MEATTTLLVKANLRLLRLPAMHAEFEKLAREAATANEDHQQYLLRLSEAEVAARASIKLAMLAQAISITSPATAIRTVSGRSNR